MRQVAFRHRPDLGEGAAIVAEIFVDGHIVSLRLVISEVGAGGQARPSRTRRRSYLSGESGIWMSPLMCLMGPAADGMTSKSKISVGSHSVAQALGTSTTPEI